MSCYNALLQPLFLVKLSYHDLCISIQGIIQNTVFINKCLYVKKTIQRHTPNWLLSSHRIRLFWPQHQGSSNPLHPLGPSEGSSKLVLHVGARLPKCSTKTLVCGTLWLCSPLQRLPSLLGDEKGQLPYNEPVAPITSPSMSKTKGPCAFLLQLTELSPSILQLTCDTLATQHKDLMGSKVASPSNGD